MHEEFGSPPQLFLPLQLINIQRTIMEYVLYLFLPSEYNGGSSFKNGEPLAPQAGCLTLLQAPEGVLYLVGGHGFSDRTLQGVLAGCILFPRL